MREDVFNGLVTMPAGCFEARRVFGSGKLVQLEFVPSGGAYAGVVRGQRLGQCDKLGMLPRHPGGQLIEQGRSHIWLA